MPAAAGRFALLALDLTATVWLLWRLTRPRPGERVQPGEDAAERIERGVRRALGGGPVAHVVALELATLYYALRPPRRRAASAARDAGAPDLTCRAARSAAVTGALILAVAAETAPMHLLLRHWSPAAAWVLSALSVYSLLWLVGDYRAMGARTSGIIGRVLVLRCGLRLAARIPVAVVEGVEPVSWRDAPPRAPGYLSATGFAQGPNLVVRLRAPVTVSGPLGIRRTCERVGLRLDAPAEAGAGHPPLPRSHRRPPLA